MEKNFTSKIETVQSNAEKIKIDLSKTPSIPEGYKLVSHDASIGSIELDFSKILLHESKYASSTEALFEAQRGGYNESQVNDDFKHMEEVAAENKHVLNATFLDYLMKNQELIPDSWKIGREIIFPGTVYVNSYGEKIFRSLHWVSKREVFGRKIDSAHWADNAYERFGKFNNKYRVFACI